MMSKAWMMVMVVITGPVASAATDSRELLIPNGIVRPIRDIQVPARQPGVLTHLHVREGYMARTEELLAQVDDADANLRLAVAQREYEAAAEQAKEDVKVQEALATEEVAKAEYADSLEANRRSPGAVQNTQLRREELMAKRAGLQVKVAAMEYAVARINAQAQLAKAQVIEHEIHTRQIVAPFDGLVAEILRQEGEWVQAGDPVLRLVQMNRLRVEGLIDSNEVAPHKLIGRKAVVRVKLPGGEEHKTDAVVNYVSQLVEGDRKYRIHVEIDNVPALQREQQTYWLIRPGMFADVTIMLAESQ